MADVTRRDAVLKGLGAAVAMPALTAVASSAAAQPTTPGAGAVKGAKSHKFEMNIEEAEIKLVGDMRYNTFAFGGQVPAPLIHVREGDHVELLLNNLTTLNHTIHWHGILQRHNWQMDGVPDVTQFGIQPGESFTYKFVAEPSGTLWYHCHVNVNEHVAYRGMWGPLIVDPLKPLPIERKVTGDYILMFTEWTSKWAQKLGEGGLPDDVNDYFTINGKAFPETQPIRVKEGDLIRLRLYGAGGGFHSIHIHGHVFDVVFKDGRPLPAPYQADTLLLGPGERYDILLNCDNPGRWMIHDHVDLHTVNGRTPMGGIMSVIEYEEISRDQPYYHWAHKEFQPDFFYEESLKKPHGMHENPNFKGKLLD